MTGATLARAYVTLFVISTAFPVALSLMPATSVSRAMGFLDVAIALVLVATGIHIVSARLPTTPENDRRAITWYKVTGTIALVLLVVFFIAGSRVRWEVLLTGLAWRAWLWMHSLPAMLAMARLTAGPSADSKERLS
jgi:hypothetical protein